MLRAWRTTRRKTSNFVVVDDLEKDQTHPKESLDVATRHWATVFAEKTINEEDARYFLQFLPVPTTRVECPARGALDSLTAAARSSAPGPDGITVDLLSQFGTQWRLHLFSFYL